MRRHAFTLIELLVVVAIIGLLSTIAVVSLNNARSNSRNAKRTADLKQYMTAFAVAYSANNSYPASGDACISASCFGAWNTVSLDNNVDNFFSPYIKKPVDPTDTSRGRGGYIFTGGWSGGSSNGNYFPPGPIISYSLEKAVNCPFGQIWWQGTSETECVVNINF